MDDIIIIRGAGDIATGIAHRLYKCGFRLASHGNTSLVIRRLASFCKCRFGRGSGSGGCTRSKSGVY